MILFSHLGPWNKNSNFIFHLKYVLPKSLKVTLQGINISHQTGSSENHLQNAIFGGYVIRSLEGSHWLSQDSIFKIDSLPPTQPDVLPNSDFSRHLGCPNDRHLWRKTVGSCPGKFCQKGIGFIQIYRELLRFTNPTLLPRFGLHLFTFIVYKCRQIKIIHGTSGNEKSLGIGGWFILPIPMGLLKTFAYLEIWRKLFDAPHDFLPIELHVWYIYLHLCTIHSSQM